MMKYLTRAMGAFKTPYQRELEGRRAYFREEQAKIKANNAKVAAAMARGDVQEALHLAQPGLRVDQTDSQRRLAEVYAEDDALFARVEREQEQARERIAVIRAQQEAGAKRSVTFADNADQARYVELCKAHQYGAAAEFLRERIACGMAVESVQQ
jgi:hypothetical protein